MARSFEQIYAAAPRAAVGRLLAFRERYPYRYAEHHDRLYRIWDVNEAENPRGTVVFLPSGIGHGEIWFPFMLELRRDYRCVAFSLAEDETPEPLAQAILDILKDKGIDKFLVAANSVGGLIAQLLAKAAPERVAALSLMMTGAPAADLDPQTRANWALRRKMRRQMRFQNYSDAQKLGMANRVFESICPEQYQENQGFWLGFIEETFAQYVYKAQHLAINTALVPHIYEKYRLTPADFSKDLKVQIIESRGDRLYSAQERECLKRLFPSARVSDIGDAGQYSLQLNEQKALELFGAFLKEVFA